LSVRTAELQHLATTDLMTGVNNRHHFLSLLYHEFARGRRYKTPLSLMVLDLDFFKQINDGYGHAAGDAALKAFSAIASECLRDMDVFGRLGGEEFGILLPSTAVDQAEAVAERIRAAVARIAIDTEFGTVRFTTSIGVTQGLDTDESVDILLARADAALYGAKAAGRNRVVVRAS
jgi:diguanylate cyclase (GGDEF)-like protein